MKYELIDAADAPPPGGWDADVPTTPPPYYMGYTREDLEEAHKAMNEAATTNSKKNIRETREHFNLVWQYIRENHL